MASDEHNVSSSTDPISVLTISPHGTVELGDIKGEMTEDEEAIAVGSASLLTNQGYLSVVSPTLSNPTLQSLLSSPTVLQGTQLGLPPGVQIGQIVTVSNPSDMLTNQSIDMDGHVWHVLNPEQAIIAVGDVDLKPALIANSVETMDESEQVGSTDMLTGSAQDIANVLMPPPATPLPLGCPTWAARFKNCERIGNYYRGYVETEAELDILLTYHKQATQSFWGTRQSPSPAKMSTRFMWKSQYVPYDGIPFVNTGSRAVVQECQFGPRRKGTLAKKQNDNSSDYKQTCPARIYIKKVRKFPEFKIDSSLDKKGTKEAMDKAFHNLKQTNIDKVGQDRFYVQLPLQSAHEFHDAFPPQMITVEPVPVQTINTTNFLESQSAQSDDDKGNRLNPLVAQKIRQVVAGGETRVYQVRRLLRSYVCREIYNGNSDSVQRHDLSLFPTVTDLKNHIHQAVKDIQNGSLPLTAPTVNVEAMNANTDPLQDLNVWPQNVVASGPVPETVTVTLTQGPGDDGGHVISRIETHLSDGTTQISTSLTPETAQLLARLNPSMFPPGSLVQLQAGNQQSGLNGDEKFDSTFCGIDMEVQDSSQFTENLTIQTTDSSPLPIPVLGTGTVVGSDLLTKENGSISEQNTELIDVAMVPVSSTLEDLQEEHCDEEL